MPRRSRTQHAPKSTATSPRRDSSWLLIFPRGALLAAFFFFLPSLGEDFEVPKAAAVLVLGGAALGVALGSLRSLRALRPTWIDAGAAAILASDLASTLVSDSRSMSLFGDPTQRDGLLTEISLAGIYLATRLGTRRREDAAGTLRVVFAASLVAGAYALLQACGLDPIPWGRTSAFGSLMLRPFATFGHPNLLGIVSSAAVSAGLAAWLMFPSRRLLPALAAVVGAAVTVLTLSRGAWLAAGAGIAVGLGCVLASGGAIRARGRVLAASLGALAVALAGLWLTGWGALLRARFAQMLFVGSGSGRARLEIWRSAIGAWKDRPWLGHGLDTFALAFPRFQTPDYWKFEWGGLPLHAHSIYFDTLATRGLVGLAAGAVFVAAVAVAAIGEWRKGGWARRLVPVWAAGAGALAVAGAFGSLGIGGTLLWVVFGASLASIAADPGEGSADEAGARRAEKKGRTPLRPSQRGTPDDRAPDSAPGSWASRYGGRLAAVVLALLALAWSIPALWASHLDRMGQDLAGFAGGLRGDDRREALRQAVAAYRRAAAFAPLDDRILQHEIVSTVSLAAQSGAPLEGLALAASRSRRAIALQPLRPDNHQCLGAVLMIRAKAGDRSGIEEGERSYARAIALAPQDVTVRTGLARDETDLGRGRLALAPAEQALEMYPNMGDAMYQRARALLALGERDRAREAIEGVESAEWRGDAIAQRDAMRLRDALRAAAGAPAPVSPAAR